jgi:hypothetical protein
MEDKKLCKPCNTLKYFDEFGKFKQGKFGLNSHCKTCRKEYDQQHRVKLLEYHKIKRGNELEKFKLYDKKYKSENKEKQNQYNSKKWKYDIQYKIRKSLRSRFHSALKQGKKHKSILSIIGCSLDELTFHIEKQFLPEFTWGNHGEIWEIDHISPCASFNLMLLEEQEKCFHFTNLQPLFKTTEIAENFGYNNIIGNRNKKDKT